MDLKEVRWKRMDSVQIAKKEIVGGGLVRTIRDRKGEESLGQRSDY